MRLPVSRRLSACRRWLLGSSCARWGVAPTSRSAYRQNRSPDPNGVVMLRMNKIRPGRAPPLPRGRWCAPGRRLFSGAPAAFQRPVPTAPLNPSHRRGSPSRGVIGGSPAFTHHSEATGCRPRAGKRTGLPPVLSSPATTGWNGSRFGFDPGLRTPQSPAEHAGAETGPRALARVLHLWHQPNLQTVPPTSLMHPHVAPTRKSPPAPPPGTPRHATSPQPKRPGR